MTDQATNRIAASGGAPVELRLYVAGHAAPSARARREIERLRPQLERAGGRIDVIDVLGRPDVAEQERIVATPVLVRVSPPPRRSIVGDLSDLRTLSDVLDLGLAPLTAPLQPTEEDAR